MTELAAAAADALGGAGTYVLISGRPAPAWQPLAARAQRHIVSPGPTTRLAVAAGVALGGHRAIAVVDAGCTFTEGFGELAFTESQTAAHAALRSGWAVVQPWRPTDVAELLDRAPRPAVVLLSPRDPAVATGDLPSDGPLRVGSPATAVWRDGELATVIAAGDAVGALLRIGERLHARGVAVHEVEVPVLTTADHAPLIGGDALFVGGADAALALTQDAWPRPLARVPIDGADDAELMGRVLSQIRTR